MGKKIYSDGPGSNPREYYELLLIYLPAIVLLRSLVLALSSEYNNVNNTNSKA